MNITLLIYLAGIVDPIKYGLIVVCVFGCIASIMLCICKEAWTTFNSFLVCGILSLLLFTGLIPSERTIYLMAASEIGQDIAKNERVSATMDKLFKIVDGKLDEQLTKIAKEK